MNLKVKVKTNEFEKWNWKQLVLSQKDQRSIIVDFFIGEHIATLIQTDVMDRPRIKMPPGTHMDGSYAPPHSFIFAPDIACMSNLLPTIWLGYTKGIIKHTKGMESRWQQRDEPQQLSPDGGGSFEDVEVLQDVRDCHQPQCSQEPESWSEFLLPQQDQPHCSYVKISYSYQSMFCPSIWRRRKEGWWSSRRRSKLQAWTRTCQRQQWTGETTKYEKPFSKQLYNLKSKRSPWWRSRPWRKCWRRGRSAVSCSLPTECRFLHHPWK